MLDMDVGYSTFKYIHSPAHEHNAHDVLDKKYRCVEDLGSRFVVKSTEYRVYETAAAFMRFMGATAEADRIFHEVVFNTPQKLKFDIDAPLDRVLASALSDVGDFIDECVGITPAERYQHILSVIIQEIRQGFFIVFGKDLDDRDIIICESADPAGQKFSNHVIIDNYYVSGHEQAREFTRRLGTYLPECYRVFLDLGVNKCIQNFRMVNCHKIGTVRTKRVISGHFDERCIIANVAGCELLADIVSAAATPAPVIVSEDLAAVLKMCMGEAFKPHVYRNSRNNQLVFDRLYPSYCDICEKDHHTDNTLLVSIASADGTLTAFRQCRKDAEGSSILLGSATSVVSICPEGEAKISWVDKSIVAALKTAVPSVELTNFDNLVVTSKHIYTSDKLAPFELVPTLVVHAAMKMGKTKALHEHIDKYFSGGIAPRVIRFISFRQTFSGNIKEKFKDFTLYSDVKGPLTCAKLIVQVESLWRLDIQAGDAPPDLLILDECESIFEQFDSGLLRGNFNECFAKFQYLMRFSKYVICMDANVSNRTYNILAKMRDRPLLYHHNLHKNATEDKYYICGDKFKWLGMLYASVECGERVAVPMSSLGEAKVLEKALSKQNPGKNIKLYCGETPSSEKREHFADVNTYWATLDVLIYTPTVSAGVSFEQKHFDKIFGYFTDMSCPVETCQQMIGRIRDVASHEFYIYLAATGNNLPTSTVELANVLNNRRDNLTRKFDEMGLTVVYTGTGEAIYHTSDYFHIWLENARVRNLSRNYFIRRFIKITTRTGAHAEYLSDTMFKDFTGDVDTMEIKAENSLLRAEIKQADIKGIASAPDATEQEVDEIKALIIAQADITVEQRYMYSKHRLRVEYRYMGEINEKFVAKYHDPKVRRVFKNVARLGVDLRAGLDRIQEEERASHKYLMGQSLQDSDLNRHYVYDQHRYALGLLKLCGWRDLDDCAFIHEIQLKMNLRDNEKIYWDTIRPACIEFDLKSPKVVIGADDVGMLIRPVSAILGIMYNVSIASRKQDPLMYQLRRVNLFTYDEQESIKRKIPCIPRGET